MIRHSHPCLKTPYVRNLMAAEIAAARRASRRNGERIKPEEMSMYIFGMETAYFRIDHHLLTGELEIEAQA